MSLDSDASLFVLLGQTAEKTIARIEEVVPKDSLLISPSYDLAALVPDKVRRATEASEAFRLFFVFEEYLRELIVEILSEENKDSWWDKVPKDVKDYVASLEATEEMKGWMALGSRDKSALMTLPQLLRIIEENWKGEFDDVIRDKGLIQEARLLVVAEMDSFVGECWPELRR